MSLNQIVCLRIRYILLTVFLLVCMAESLAAVDVDIRARIVNNTCDISVENNGNVSLPMVSRDYFNSRGNPPAPLSPTDAAGGTPFNISVNDCTSSSGSKNQLHFQFSPNSGQFWTGSNQVFINEISPAAGGANNVGVVVFSGRSNTNVLKSDGSSDVIFNIASQSSGQYLTDYPFYVRYQNVGSVSAGRVTSNVTVSVIYD